MPTVDAPPRNAAASLRARVRALRGGWLAWRIAVTVVGVAVIAGGIVLLPLPGPGWLIIFTGLGLLATEYEWAARLLRWTRRRVMSWARSAAARPLWLRVLASFAAVVVIVGLVVAAWFVTV